MVGSANTINTINATGGVGEIMVVGGIMVAGEIAIMVEAGGIMGDSRAIIGMVALKAIIGMVALKAIIGMVALKATMGMEGITAITGGNHSLEKQYKGDWSDKKLQSPLYCGDKLQYLVDK
jgi:hypothetical protein